MLGLAFLLTEGWLGPALTMIINTISPKNKGFAVSAFFFACTMSGTIANILNGWLLNYYDCPCNKTMYGRALCLICVSAYIISIPFFWLAGHYYTKFKKDELKMENEYLIK
jgi:MFS family permease